MPILGDSTKPLAVDTLHGSSIVIRLPWGNDGLNS